MPSPAPHPRPLPERPNLRHLKDQAKDMLRAGGALSLAEAQFKIAHFYGFAGWTRLKEHVESLEEVGKLKHAIDTNDFGAVRTLMTRNPALHRAPLGYGKAGPLTWVAECRIPWEPPTPARLGIAQWLIDNGSDVHQGGDAPIMRAALVGHRVPMMDLLVRNGADVNAEWNGSFPIIYAPCETVEPLALRWLLEHGADPNLPTVNNRDSALDYLIGTYARSARLPQCIDLLMNAGCRSRRAIPAVLELLRGRLDHLGTMLKCDPSLAHQRFQGLDFGATGGRRLTLAGGTLLHVAAEFGNAKAAQLLMAHGAEINARADAHAGESSGHTPIFHSISQFGDFGLTITRYLVEAGADVGFRVRLPGRYDEPSEFVECTPLGYARIFPGNRGATIAFLESLGAPE